MPWDADAPHGGFSAVEPWLPVPHAHLQRAVSVQQRMPGSPLNRLRLFLNWRKHQRELRAGEMIFHDTEEPVLGLSRRLDGSAICCLFNLGPEEMRVKIDAGICGRALEGHGFGCHAEDGCLHLPAWGAWFGRTAA